MKAKNKYSTDRLGLTGIWHTVPPEGPRPQSAIDYDRKSDDGVPRKIAEYSGQLAAYNRKRTKRLLEEKQSRAANEHSADTDN